LAFSSAGGRIEALVAGYAAITRLADSHLLGLIEPDDIAGANSWLSSRGRRA
jgi:hypothetical protein